MSIFCSACRQRHFLRVVQNQILYAEFRRQLACIERSAMVFLIRFERVAVGIKAERFAHHPIRVHNELAVKLIVWLIAEAGDPTELTIEHLGSTWVITGTWL